PKEDGGALGIGVFPAEASRIDMPSLTSLDLGLAAAFADSRDEEIASRACMVVLKTGMLIADKYKLVERIGEGGMGTVWYAEQLVPVKRKVALKLIKPGLHSQAGLKRFEAERQSLAMMDHPNIARVLDGG